MESYCVCLESEMPAEPIHDELDRHLVVMARAKDGRE